MKIVIPGGTGQIGQILSRALTLKGHEVVVISRNKASDTAWVEWDGQTLGEWTKEIDGCDVVINLAGRSVNCRYTDSNLSEMMNSRVLSTKAVGDAIALAKNPPELWLQMSTATIYSHRFDAPNDEMRGEIGGKETDTPAYWKTSIDIAEAWERELEIAATPRTRKIAMRSAMVMSPDAGGIFSVLLKLVKLGLGGSVGGGHQFISWIHEDDFVRAIEFLISNKNLEGAINLTSPEPLPQKAFMSDLRKAWGTSIGLPATKWMAEIGAFILRTDTELLLKSRRVVPTRLTDAGFKFNYSNWKVAAMDLVKRWRKVK